MLTSHIPKKLIHCGINPTNISQERVENVSDELTEGDIVTVKVLEVDKQGRIRLSMKAVES